MNWSMKQWFDRCLILDIRHGLSTQVYYRLIVSFCRIIMSNNSLSLVLFRREKVSQHLMQEHSDPSSVCHTHSHTYAHMHHTHVQYF